MHKFQNEPKLWFSSLFLSWHMNRLLVNNTLFTLFLENSTPEMKWVLVTRPVILQRTTSRRRSSPPSTKDVFPAKQETAHDVTFPHEKGVMDDKATKAEQEECKTGGIGSNGGTYTKKEGKKVRRSITQSKGQSSRGSVVTDIGDEDLPSVRKLRCN